MRHLKYNSLLLILPVLGISFWFLIAFPFGDRNESYIWIAYLEKYTLPEILQNSIPSIRSYRPLAQAGTWCLYRLSGGNGILIQVLNFALLCVAISVMIPLTPRSRLNDARLLYFVIPVIYFSAFYYIFNLHGIFYSVILLLVAFMLKAQQSVMTKWKAWLSICCVLALFHPLILLLYVTYLVGWLMEERKISGNRILPLAVMLAILIAMVQLLLPFPIFSAIDIQNLVGTLRNVETYVIVKIFTLMLCLLTLSEKSAAQRRFLIAVAAIYLPLAIIYDVPFMLLLGFLIAVTLMMERKWSLAALVVAAFLFPLTVGSGAPTKASIFIFLLPHVLMRSAAFSFVNKEWIPKSISIAALSGIIVCTVLVRLEKKIPLLSGLIRPLLVEKGKTYQLREALTLSQQSNPNRRIIFLQEKADDIRDEGQPTQRDYFPPTKQKEFDVYQNHRLDGQHLLALPKWYMAFGTELPADTLVLILTLEEKNCRPAYIYEVAPPVPVKETRRISLKFVELVFCQ